MSSLSPEAERLADAATAGDLPRLRELLAQLPTAPPERDRWDLNNAFIMAAAHGQVAVLTHLYVNCPDPGYDRDHALQFAAINGHAKATRCLMDWQGDPRKDDQAALRAALRKNDTAVIALLAPSADFDALAQRLRNYARWGASSEDVSYWAHLDRLAPHATAAHRATWVTWSTAEHLPWLHAHAQALARQEALGHRPAESQRHRWRA